MAKCTATANTVCQCPLGNTGQNCMEDCVAPEGCDGVVLSAINSCQFSTTDFGAGVPCLTCKPGYYLTDASHCNGIEKALKHVLSQFLCMREYRTHVYPGIDLILSLSLSRTRSSDAVHGLTVRVQARNGYI